MEGLSRMVYMLLALTICFPMEKISGILFLTCSNDRFLCTNSRLCLEGQDESTQNNCISRTEWASADTESQSKVCAMPVLESKVPLCIGAWGDTRFSGKRKQHFVFWAHYYQHFLLPSLKYMKLSLYGMCISFFENEITFKCMYWIDDWVGGFYLFIFFKSGLN